MLPDIVSDIIFCRSSFNNFIVEWQISNFVQIATNIQILLLWWYQAASMEHCFRFSIIVQWISHHSNDITCVFLYTVLNKKSYQTQAKFLINKKHNKSLTSSNLVTYTVFEGLFLNADFVHMCIEVYRCWYVTPPMHFWICCEYNFYTIFIIFTLF